MKRVRFSNILVAVGVFAILLIAPYLLNTLIDGVYREYGYQIPLYFNLDTWYDIMSIAFPAALTYIVIRQSERQQKDNMEMQKSLERINEKMLDLEKKSKIGYFVPHVKLKDAGIDGFEHSYIRSEMSNDNLFVIMMLSKNYYSSPVCLNEMGAAWIKQSTYQSILLPGFDYPDIQGAINPRDISFKLSDRENRTVALNEFKDRIVAHLDLEPVDHTLWERFRDSFIAEIDQIIYASEANE